MITTTEIILKNPRSSVNLPLLDNKDDNSRRERRTAVKYLNKLAKSQNEGTVENDQEDSVEVVDEQAETDAEFVMNCVNEGKCTYTYTNENYVVQKWYQCITCGLVDKRGCCESCKKKMPQKS